MGDPVTIQFEAATAGYQRGERALVDPDDQRVKDLIAGEYARVVTDDAETAAPAPPEDPPEGATRPTGHRGGGAPSAPAPQG